MKNRAEFLKDTQLFLGVSEDEISAMLGCLNARESEYKKGEYIYHRGDIVGDIMLLVSGKVHVQRDDFWGNSNIISTIDIGEMFGESCITTRGREILNNVIAIEDSTIMLFDVRRILTTCSSSCKFHNMVIENLFYAISDKNRKLVQKLGHMANRSTREKLMSYLSEQSQKQGSDSFVIPLNRQQLADFLSVDRSAMSNELGKLRDEGLIEFDRSRFRLLHADD